MDWLGADVLTVSESGSGQRLADSGEVVVSSVASWPTVAQASALTSSILPLLYLYLYGNM